MDLLDEAEALELIELDSEGPQVIPTFLKKHVNLSLSSEEQGAIMKGFCQTNCRAKQK